MRVRSSRVFTYAVGWAVLTVLAAGAVWWGLRPLLAPLLSPVAAPPATTPSASPPVSPSVAPSPAATPSKAPVTTPVRTDSPKPTPSYFDGWAYDGTAFTRTFDTAGGQALIRIAGGRVEVVSATPSAGYQMSSQQPHPERVVLRFDRVGQSVIIDAMWWENRPYAEVTTVS